MSRIDQNTQEGKYIALISLDFKSAFNSLPWDATIEELENLQIEPPYF